MSCEEITAMPGCPRSSLTGSPVGSAQLFKELTEAQAGLASCTPEEVRVLAAGFARRLGRAEALREWECRVEQVEKAAAEGGWDGVRMFAVLFSMLARAALQSVEDDWSGRGNDFRRAVADGRREVLTDAQQALEYHLCEVVGRVGEGAGAAVGVGPGSDGGGRVGVGGCGAGVGQGAPLIYVTQHGERWVETTAGLFARVDVEDSVDLTYLQVTEEYGAMRVCR